METKITTASIRIALSHQFSTFEVALHLDNPDGITTHDVAEARLAAQSLANDAVNEYKRLPNATVKDEVKRVENKITEIKKMIGEGFEEIEKQPTPEEIAKVEALPMYEPKTAKPLTDKQIANRKSAGKTIKK